MYLMDFQLLIKQMLPIQWRNTYKDTILNIFIMPFKHIYNAVLIFKNEILLEINLNSQVGVLENYLNTKYAKANYLHISIGDGLNGEVVIYVAKEYINKKNEIKKDVIKYLPMGFKLKIE